MGFIKSKKKMLVVFASPHEFGATRTLLEAFLRPFKSDGDWEINEINAYELSPAPCTGCGECAKKETCIFGDLDDFDKKLRECELFVVASSVYNFSFPSPFKAMLDRMQRYFEARFSLGKSPAIKKHRHAVLLAAMGSEDDYALEVMTKQLERSFSVMNTELSGCAIWQGTDIGKANKSESLKKADSLALEIIAKV